LISTNMTVFPSLAGNKKGQAPYSLFTVGKSSSDHRNLPEVVSDRAYPAEWIVTLIGLTLSVITALTGCEGELPKHIQYLPDAWRTIPVGQPLTEVPKVRVVEEGKGPAITTGQLVKINIVYRMDPANPANLWNAGDWWVWTGFEMDPQATPFYTNTPEFASALIGLREGTQFEIIASCDNPECGKPENRGPGSSFYVFQNVIGPSDVYNWQKNLVGRKDITSTGQIYASFRSDPGSLVRILAVCDAELKVRSVRLFDDSPVRIFSPGAHDVNAISETWIDESLITGKCSDGRTATFQYGPIGSATKQGRGSPIVGYFDKWFKDAWDQLPVGVQVK
jgi:hypothetical protein